MSSAATGKGKGKASKRHKDGFPIWVGVYYRDAYESFERTVKVIHASRRGLAGTVAMPRLNKAIAAATGEDLSEEQVERYEAEANLARREVDENFPVLHSLALVAIWSWLEHLIKGVLIRDLMHSKKALKSKSFEKIKVSISDYASLTGQDRAAFIVDAVEQETKAKHKAGINRFEALLDVFGLSGPIPDGISDALFELQQFRNVVAHQNGRCDRKFRSKCPWVKQKIGDQLIVSDAQLKRFSSAVSDYALEILYRIGDRDGRKIRPSAGDAQK